MKKRILYLIVFAIATSCGKKSNESSDIKSDGIKVKTENTKIIKGSSLLRYSGTIEPSQTIPLSFQSSGIVDAVHVNAGEIVRKGQILAVVNKADNQNMLDVSNAKYLQAKDAYDRMKSVYEKGSLTEVKWVEMETNYQQAKSQMEIAKANLEKCNLRAPDNGMIGSRNVEPGQSSISPNTPLELVKIETVMVKIAVPENEISKIQKGLKASFSISALDGKAFEGQVTHVGIVADRISRTYEVKISVANQNLEIKPGMVCDVALNINSEKELLIIPNRAVLKDNDGKTYVFVISDDKHHVKKLEIKTGNYQASGIEIVSGLTANETVVVEGKEKLSDNSLISL